MLSNKQRNEYFANILSYDFNACQLKFILYLYNTTINLQKLSIKIPNLAKLAESLGYHRANFRRDVNTLIENDVVTRTKSVYTLNFECKTWHTDPNRLKTVRNRMNIDISRQLSGEKK